MSTNVKNNLVLVELLIVQSITLLLCTLRNAARSRFKFINSLDVVGLLVSLSVIVF